MESQGQQNSRIQSSEGNLVVSLRSFVRDLAHRLLLVGPPNGTELAECRRKTNFVVHTRSTTTSESITARSVDSRGILRGILEDLAHARSSSDTLLLVYGMQSLLQMQL